MGRPDEISGLTWWERWGFRVSSVVHFSMSNNVYEMAHRLRHPLVTLKATQRSVSFGYLCATTYAEYTY
jgi:hypothetical protein